MPEDWAKIFEEVKAEVEAEEWFANYEEEAWRAAMAQIGREPG